MFEDGGSCRSVGLIVDDAFVAKTTTHLQLTDQPVSDGNILLSTLDALLQSDEEAVELLL
mgnify:CR=1 FL=1